MSILVIQLPARERLASRKSEALPAAVVPTEFDYVFSVDGNSVVRTGRSAPALWPKADSVVAVLADNDVSWHRINIPKAPAARLRAALAGAMEEVLLDEDPALHFALAVDSFPGRNGWVGVMHKPWLQAMLAALERTGLQIERLIPASAPGKGTRGHFFNAETGNAEATALVLSGPNGVVCVRLAGALARKLQPSPQIAVHWTATPEATGAAERWLGAAVDLRTEAARVLKAARSDHNLRQFDLATRTRGTRALRDATRRFMSAEWRPVRIGLASLVALQLVGLNAYAWQQRRGLAEQRAAMTQLLRDTHPGVRTVLDAPAQMQRETERLRAAAGRPGDGDLEVLLTAAAAAWPDGQGPVQMLRFETGRLTVAASGWGEPQVAQFRSRLASSGFVAELTEGRISITRSAARGAA
jgi:general secretion pathway protein L